MILITMLNNLNLNLLKYFYVVVKEGNITKASNKLNISQPAVTKAIKDLEDELNTKLFERNKKGVIPTNEGLILYEHTKEILDNLSTTINKIEREKKKGGVIYIGTTTTNFGLFVQDALKKFKEANPLVHINIVKAEIRILNDYAKIGKLDIVIKNNYEEIDNFKKVQAFRIDDKFIASINYFPEFKDKVFSLKELLDNYPLILLTGDVHHGRKNFDRYLKSLGIDYKPTYEFGSYSLCRELIRDGFGIGIGNPVNYKDKEYVVIKTDFDLPTRNFDIGYIDTSSNKLIPNFIEYIKKM